MIFQTLDGAGKPGLRSGGFRQARPEGAPVGQFDQVRSKPEKFQVIFGLIFSDFGQFWPGFDRNGSKVFGQT